MGVSSQDEPGGDAVTSNPPHLSNLGHKAEEAQSISLSPSRVS